MGFNDNSINGNSPCKGCKNKTMGCHINCCSYIDWKEEHNSRTELYKASKADDNLYRGFMSESSKRRRNVRPVISFSH